MIVRQGQSIIANLVHSHARLFCGFSSGLYVSYATDSWQDVDLVRLSRQGNVNYGWMFLDSAEPVDSSVLTVS